MKYLRLSSLFVVALFVTTAAIAQSPTAEPHEKENVGVRHLAPAQRAIIVKWPMKNLDGSANLVINPDGSYVFSGNVKDPKPNRDFDITIGLKSSLGAVILFHFSGDDTNGVQWSKQGKSAILKDNYQTFAGRVDWSGEWRLPLSAKGVAKLYEEREKRKERLKKEEEEARLRKDDKMADRKMAERAKHERQEIAEAQAAARGQQSQPSGGSNIVSDITGTVSTISSVIGTISSVGQAIAGLF